MSRNFGRDLVYGTMKDFGVEPQSVTKKTKIGTVFEPEIHIKFVRTINAKLPYMRDVGVSEKYVTVGQLVQIAQMSASSLPGKEEIPGWEKPVPPREKKTKGVI